MTPLHLLISSFNTHKFSELLRLTETIQIFVDRNADLNLLNDTKKSLLHLAVAKPNYTAVSILINQPTINLNVYLYDYFNIIRLFDLKLLIFIDFR